MAAAMIVLTVVNEPAVKMLGTEFIYSGANCSNTCCPVILWVSFFSS